MAVPAQSIDLAELERAFLISEQALAKVKIMPKLNPVDEKRAHVMLDIAKRYVADALYFKEKGDLLNAFGAVYYAHGWLDCGARIGLFDVDNDTKLFTVDPEDIP